MCFLCPRLTTNRKEYFYSKRWPAAFQWFNRDAEDSLKLSKLPAAANWSNRTILIAWLREFYDLRATLRSLRHSDRKVLKTCESITAWRGWPTARLRLMRVCWKAQRESAQRTGENSPAIH